jgi:N-acetylmuramoyl-L-alanine amidase
MRKGLLHPVLLGVGLVIALLVTASFSTNSRPENAKIRVVCIDAGHGGKDPGCHGDSANEKDVALAIALKLGAYIEKYYPDVKVVYTRKTDVFVELNERAAIANRNNADLFICIHCNSACVRRKQSNGKFKDVCNETAAGAETYIMGLHKTDGNLEVAKRENEAATLEDDYQNKYNMGLSGDEAAIILSMYQNIHLENSTLFAQFCQDQFRERAGRDDKGVKQAGFLVLWKTSMPSVLIETGFLTNPAEERFLGSSKGQTHMAASIFRAFRKWKDEVEGITHTYDDEVERMKPYKVEKEDTAGLRRPYNYVSNTGPKPPVVKKDTAKPKSTPVPVVVVKDTAKTAPVASKNVVTYRVQIITSEKALPDNSPKFKGLKDVWHYQQGGMWKYTAGEYLTLGEAIQRQAELRTAGFTEAFVVAFNQEGKRITVDEAKKLNGGK